MLISQLAHSLNKYAAHSVLGNDAEKRAYANLVWDLWKQASGVGEQLKQNLSEERLKRNISKMNRTAEQLVSQGGQLLHPQMIQPKTAGFMDLGDVNHNLSIALIAESTAKALEPKYALSKTAQEINAEFGAQMLLENMGLQVCSRL
jgi:hypothetical protein